MWLLFVSALTNVAHRKIGFNETFYAVQASVNSYEAEELIYVDFTATNFGGQEVELFLNDQKNEVKVKTADNGVGQATIVAANDLGSLAFVPSFYSYDLLFLGTNDIPDEIKAHVNSLGCVDNVAVNFPSTSIPMKDKNGNVVSRLLDLSYEPAPTILEDCFSPLPTFELCQESDRGLSLNGIGFYKDTSKICFYKTYENETDYVNAFFTSSIIIAFVAFFMHILGFLHHGVSDENVYYMWQNIILYTPLIADVILLCITIVLFGNINSNMAHQLYNLASVRMHSLSLVTEVIWYHTFVALPIIGAVALYIVFFANLQFSTPRETPLWWFSWGIEINSTIRKILYGVNVFVLFGSIGIVGTAWFMVSNDALTTAIVSVCYTLSVILSSSFSKLLQVLPKNKSITPETFYLVLGRMLIEFILLSTITAITPYDVAGVLSESFSSGLSLVLGITMLCISGRDTAWAISLATNFIQIVSVVIFAVYIVFYCVIFSISLFAESGALRNRVDLAVLCTVVFSIEIFALSFGLSTAKWKIKTM